MEGFGESIRDLLLRYYLRIRLEELCQYVKNAFSVGIKWLNSVRLEVVSHVNRPECVGTETTSDVAKYFVPTRTNSSSSWNKTTISPTEAADILPAAALRSAPQKFPLTHKLKMIFC
jgi:hypothetical protein